MFVATLIAAGKLTDEVVREGIDRLAATGHDVGAPHWIDEHDAADIVFHGSLVSARKELADELNVHAGEDGSAEQNIALHKAVMAQLAANGGIVPDSMRD